MYRIDMDRRACGLVMVVMLVAGVVDGKSVATSSYDQRQHGEVNVQIDVKDLQIVALLDSDMLDYTNYDYAYDYADFTIKPSSRPTTSRPPENNDSSSSSSSTADLWSTSSSAPSDSSNSGSSSSSSSFDETPSTSANPADPIITAPTKTTVSEEASPTTPVKALPDTTSTSPSAPLTAATTESYPATIIVHVRGNFTELEDASTAASPIKIEAEKLQQQKEATTPSTTTTNSDSTAADETIKPDGTKRPPGIAEPRKRCPVGFLLKSGRCFKRRLSLISPRRALMRLAPTLLGKSQLLSRSSVAESS